MLSSTTDYLSMSVPSESGEESDPNIMDHVSDLEGRSERRGLRVGTPAGIAAGGGGDTDDGLGGDSSGHDVDPEQYGGEDVASRSDGGAVANSALKRGRQAHFTGSYSESGRRAGSASSSRVGEPGECYAPREAAPHSPPSPSLSIPACLLPSPTLPPFLPPSLPPSLPLSISLLFLLHRYRQYTQKHADPYHI